MLNNNIPNDLTIDALIFMTQQVSDCGYLPPRYFRSEGLVVVRDITAGLRYDLQAAFDRALRSPILAKGFEYMIAYDLIDAGDSRTNIYQARDRSARHV